MLAVEEATIQDTTAQALTCNGEVYTIVPGVDRTISALGSTPEKDSVPGAS